MHLSYVATFYGLVKKIPLIYLTLNLLIPQNITYISFIKNVNYNDNHEIELSPYVCIL